MMTKEESKIRNIIFCEDDEDDRNFFSDVMKEYDSALKVELVSNGVRLMQHLQHFAPDLLFLDLEMPFKNGLECLVEIRANTVLENLPVLFFLPLRGSSIFKQRMKWVPIFF